jgi:hypothetical protein
MPLHADDTPSSPTAAGSATPVPPELVEQAREELGARTRGARFDRSARRAQVEMARELMRAARRRRAVRVPRP